MPDTDDLLTAAQVADLLAVSVRTVRRYVAAGRLVPVNFGRTVRYRRADVAQLAGAGVPDQPAGVPDRSGAATSGQDASALAVEALRAELAAVRAENAALHQQVTEKAEAAGLWQGRARTLEAQLLQLTANAGQEPPQEDAETARAAPGDMERPETTSTSLSRWQRVWRALRG
jgi:excisionase family DNA binding protein